MKKFLLSRNPLEISYSLHLLIGLLVMSTDNYHFECLTAIGKNTHQTPNLLEYGQYSIRKLRR